MRRVLTPELMDDPTLDAAEHERALRGLRRLNTLSLSWRPAWRAVRDLLGPVRAFSMLDVATGSADGPVTLARAAARAGYVPMLYLCDVSPRAIEHAGTQAGHAGVDARTFVHDIVRSRPAGSWDIVTCSLFLHHLNQSDAVATLRHMAACARLGVVVTDLRRNMMGSALAWAASRAVTASRVVRTDAVLSARAAWTGDEAADLARDAGLVVSVRRAWPCRWVLTWRRP